MSDPQDSTQRFSSRVENYIKYRPSYPPAVIEILTERCGLTPDAIMADIGSGTGILTELWLKHGNPVFGVEPNREMRQAGERLLAAYPHFTSVNGTAEATTLPAQSVDFVTAGQAFHWFDGAKTRQEFVRILKPSGWAVLIWNVRQDQASPFMLAYHQLVHDFAIDLAVSHEKRIDETVLAAFYGPSRYQLATCPNQQRCDFSGMLGRLLSSSYMPNVDQASYAPMLAQAKALFAQHETGGQVVIEYETRIYYGQLTPP